MNKFLQKLDKKVLCALAALIAVLTFVVGILNVCENGNMGVGSLINSLVSIFAYNLLIFFLYKGEKAKGVVVVLILIGASVLVSLGNSINTFVMAGEYNKELEYFSGDALSKMRTMIAAVVFYGLASLVLFVGVGSHVSLKLTSKLPADKVKLVGTIAYFAAAFFAFIAFILMLVISGDFEGNQLAIRIMETLIIIFETTLLATLLNQDM